MSDGDFFLPDDSVEAGSFAGKLNEAELFRHLIMSCLPARDSSDIHRSRLRMTALLYRVAPEVLDGMSAAEVAARLGISHRAFKVHLAEADETLARQRSARVH